MAEPTTTFIANPTQRAFIEHIPEGYDPRDSSTWGRKSIACMSCRMGEGKSCGLVWSVYYHTLNNPGATWLLARDTWVNCRDTTRKEFEKWFPAGRFGEWIAGERKFVWDTEATGLEGEVYFTGLEDEKDASRLQSREYAGFGLDEPSPAAGTGGIASLIFETAMTRLRQPGMRYYSVRLAQNNPDESHWTYQKFVDPGTQGYVHFQTHSPENIRNLPPDYYKDMERDLGREDLKRRFVKGEFGFQQLGKPVTSQWSDKLHLVDYLDPVKGVDLKLLWDFGLNATCIITQVTPLGYWLILESHVLDDGGTFQLIEDVMKPVLADRFKGFKWSHIGDPAGNIREQSNSEQRATKVIRDQLGGGWQNGPKDIPARVNPLNAVLSRAVNGTGMVQVDKSRAQHVWHALRGGWHYALLAGGVVGAKPIKNKHSHPGDAMGYGAAKLFPGGKLQKRKMGLFKRPGPAIHFGNNKQFIGRPGVVLPKEAHEIKQGGLR